MCIRYSVVYEIEPAQHLRETRNKIMGPYPDILSYNSNEGGPTNLLFLGTINKAFS